MQALALGPVTTNVQLDVPVAAELRRERLQELCLALLLLQEADVEEAKRRASIAGRERGLKEGRVDHVRDPLPRHGRVPDDALHGLAELGAHNKPSGGKSQHVARLGELERGHRAPLVDGAVLGDDERPVARTSDVGADHASHEHRVRVDEVRCTLLRRIALVERSSRPQPGAVVGRSEPGKRLEALEPVSRHAGVVQEHDSAHRPN